VPPDERRTGGDPVASGKSLNSPSTHDAGHVVGRDAELERLGAVLAAAADGRSAAVLVEGEPGVGKTTLLEATRARAEGFTCLSALGVESEAHLAYAGLLGLLNPVRDLVDELPETQAEALRAALGWSVGSTTADRFLLGAATLSLLAVAAERRPVLVLVDDLQWLDPESSAAILFAARRLGPDAVALVLAARTGDVPDELRHGVPHLALGGLSASAAADLLPARATPAVVGRLVSGTNGNPLALLEVARRLEDAQWVGAAALPDPLPGDERLRAYFEATLSELSADASRAVLMLALAGTEPAAVATVTTALESEGVPADEALGEALTRGVLTHERAGYGFRHPLLRGSVVETAPPADVRTAHAALAAALPEGDDARTWHRAESVLGTDADLAQQLASLAERNRERSGFAAASTALERAADLTPDPRVAAARLSAAAHDAFVAGDVVRVRALVDRVLAGGAAGAARGEALFTLGMLEQYAGSVPLSAEYLDDASHLLDGVVLVRDLAELAMARFRLNDVAGFAECAERIADAADVDDPEQALLAQFVTGVAMTLAGDLEEGMARLADVRRLSDLPALRHDARALLLSALAAGFTGDVRDAVATGAARLQEVRRRGAFGVLMPALAILAAGRAWLGDHAGAFADAGEAAELAEHLGYAADASVAVEMLAWQSSARGLHDDARRSLELARELTDRAGTTSVAAHQAITSAYCALCRGDLAQVAALLEARLAADGGVGAGGEPLGVAPLLVEAYVGLGRGDDARSLTARFDEATPPASQPLLLALVRRCQALTEPDESAAEDSFRAALQAHADGADPFETARTRLLYGARLRRTGHRVAARDHLAEARDAFVAMDLTHWTAVATDELAASGATARRRSGDADEPLTSQETRVALLAAEGQSNREIAASLFLSPKTVERHLSNVFRKRGFRSRTQLAAAFARSQT
jgi:DNA-binding NarL/FixJ family response regulator